MPEDLLELDPELDAIRWGGPYSTLMGTIQEDFLVFWLGWGDDSVATEEMKWIFERAFPPFKAFGYQLAQLGHIHPTIPYSFALLKEGAFKPAYLDSLNYYVDDKGVARRDRVSELLAERNALRDQVQQIGARLESAVFSEARRVLMVWVAEAVRTLRLEEIMQDRRQVGSPLHQIRWRAEGVWRSLASFWNKDFGQPPVDSIQHYWWCKKMAWPGLPEIFMRRQQTAVLYYSLLRNEITDQARPFEARRLALEHIAYHALRRERVPWWEEVAQEVATVESEAARLERDKRDLNNQLAVAQRAVLKLKKKAQGKPSQQNLQELIDKHRFKSSGKVNLSATGKELGVTGDTVKRWIQEMGLSDYAKI